MNSSKFYPLASVQRQIWFDQIINPLLPVYNIGGYVKIDGYIDFAIFEKAVNRVVEDNDALRIILHKKDPLPVQEFVQSLDFKVAFYDFSDKKNAMSFALEWMQGEFVKPFELYDKHLFHFALIKVSDDCLCWFQKYHHLITDGWGISLIVQRVARAYNDIIDKKETETHELFSYKDFIEDDLQYVDSEKFQKNKEYWAQKYQFMPDSLTPSCYSHDNTKSSVTELWLKRDFYNRMAAFAKTQKASTFHFILSAMYVYFFKTSVRRKGTFLTY